MEHIQEIVNYIKDSDTGLGFDNRYECNIAIIFANRDNFNESFASISNHVFIVTENIIEFENKKTEFQELIFIEGKIHKTNLPDKIAHGIIVDSDIINFDCILIRNELKRISSNGWSDVIIIDEKKAITEDFLKFLYAGSGYETKVFSSNNSKNETIIYHNPIGYNEEELKAKEITQFLKACEDYCEVIENYNKYSIKEFLYYVQKALVNYYLKGFQFPDSSRGYSKLQQADSYSEKDTDTFFKLLNKLTTFLGKHDTYLSNFDPYPDDDDKEVMSKSLSCDIAEIYEDIKTNLNVWKFGNIYDKQEMIYQFKWDWQNHTGDHWSFAVRAIHWKLQDLEYEE